MKTLISKTVLSAAIVFCGSLRADEESPAAPSVENLAVVGANQSVTVDEGGARIVNGLTLTSNTLIKEGDGALVVGALYGLRQSDGFGQDGNWGMIAAEEPVTVQVKGGSLSLAAPVVIGPVSDVAVVPMLHFDAAAEETFVLAEDGFSVNEWRDPVSGRTAVSDFEVNMDRGPLHFGVDTAKPRLVVSERLGGKRVVDFGSYVEAQGGQLPDGSGRWYWIGDYDLSGTGALKFQDSHMREMFLVVRTKEFRKQPFLFGSTYGWVYNFSPTTDGRLCGNADGGLANGEWRIDGLKVQQDETMVDQEFHVLSILSTGLVANQNTFTLDRHCRIGGMELAEAIAYDVELAEADRRAVEAHLMAKWLGKTHPLAGPVTVGSLAYAAGVEPVLVAGRDATLAEISGTGVFTKDGSGDVTATGLGEQITGVSVAAGALAFAASGNALDVMDEAAFHIDPSDASSLEVNGDGQVLRVHDVRSGVNRFASTTRFSTAAGPTLIAAEPTGLPLLDFGTFAIYNSPTEPHPSFPPDETTCGMEWNVREQVYTICAVVEKKSDHDSFLVGDSDTYDFHADSGNLLTGYASYRVSHADQSAWQLPGTVWTLDGAPVPDPLTTPWPSGLHVITVTIADARLDGVHADGPFACYFAQDRNLCRIGGMRYGEVLVFNKTLSPAKVAAIRSYLMEKWLGSAKDTSTGYKTLSVAGGSSLSFASDITVGDDAVITLGGTRRTYGTIATTGAVLLGQHVTVDVENGQGAVKLIEAASFDGADALSTWSGSGCKVRFAIRDGALYADYPQSGLILIVK